MNIIQLRSAYQMNTYKTSALDRLTFLLRETGDQMMHCIITYNKHFNFSQLHKAMRLAIDIEPILGCVFIEHPSNPYWQRLDEIDNLDYCSLIKTSDLEKDLHSYITQDFNPHKELPIQLTVFRLAKNDVLCLKVTHTVADGGGIFEFIQLLNNIYIELDNNPNYQVNPKVVSRSLKQILKNFNFLKKIRIFLKNRSPKPTWSFPWKDTKRTNKDFIIHRISTKQFLDIKKYCKEKNVTVNDLLLTSFYRAMYQIDQPEPKKKMVTVVTTNLRNYLPDKKASSICNLSTSIYPYVSLTPNEKFEDTLQTIHNEMLKFKKNYPGLGSAVFIHYLFGRLRFSRVRNVTLNRIRKDIETHKTHPVFTNIGLIKKEQLAIGNLIANDCFFVTPIMFAPGFIFGMFTFENRMCLSVGFCEGSYEKKKIEEFLKLFESELLSVT
jgi:NRPS condensation-like uncharacterized protein